MVQQTTVLANETTIRSAQVRQVVLVAREGGPHTGIGRYVEQLQRGLRAADIMVTRVPPRLPPLPHGVYDLALRGGANLRAFFNTYPLLMNYPPADIYHLTSQNLATLLLFRRPPGPTVVTVHDIIPFMVRNDPELCFYRTPADRIFDRLAMAGLRKADVLLADSHYTKRSVVEHLGIAADKITVVHLGVDSQQFRPLTVPVEIYTRYGLPRQLRYLIYVGSEDPRKNLVTLLRALALVRTQYEDVHLLKVGAAQDLAARRKLLNLAEELEIASAIHWLDAVPEEDLPYLYNLADICVMPSRYEGFGFPVLEAMACGTPVVAADAASLPELVSGLNCLIAPLDAMAMAQALLKIMTNPSGSLAERQAWAARFQWQQTLTQTLPCYQLASHRARVE